MSLFITPVLLSGQLLNNKQLKPESHSHLSFTSRPRKQPRFSEKRKGTGQLQAGTSAISYKYWQRSQIGSVKAHFLTLLSNFPSSVLSKAKTDAAAEYQL